MGAAAEATHLASLSDTASSDPVGPGDVPPDPVRSGPNKVQDVLVPWVYQPPPNSSLGPTEKTTYHRYYHLFVEGELRGLVRDAAAEEGLTMVDRRPGTGPMDGSHQRFEPGERWLRVRGEGWEADNWWLEGEVGVSP